MALKGESWSGSVKVALVAAMECGWQSIQGKRLATTAESVGLLFGNKRQSVGFALFEHEPHF